MILHMRTTRPGAKDVISWHIVWDADRFMAARRKEAQDLLAQKNEVVAYSVASEADYKLFKGYKK